MTRWCTVAIVLPLTASTLCLVPRRSITAVTIAFSNPVRSLMGRHDMHSTTVVLNSRPHSPLKRTRLNCTMHGVLRLLSDTTELCSVSQYSRGCLPLMHVVSQGIGKRRKGVQSVLLFIFPGSTECDWKIRHKFWLRLSNVMRTAHCCGAPDSRSSCGSATGSGSHGSHWYRCGDTTAAAATELLH